MVSNQTLRLSSTLFWQQKLIKYPMKKVMHLLKLLTTNCLCRYVSLRFGFSIMCCRISKKYIYFLFLQILSEELGCQVEDIANIELNVCDTQPSCLGGANDEFIFSGRLDNLASSFCALRALIDACASPDDLLNEHAIRMVALFDNEEVIAEIGSLCKSIGVRCCLTDPHWYLFSLLIKRCWLYYRMKGLNMILRISHSFPFPTSLKNLHFMSVVLLNFCMRSIPLSLLTLTYMGFWTFLPCYTSNRMFVTLFLILLLPKISWT